jgi:two-component system, NarL family, nitrate/nitrite sensor histidine kinase NarX
VHDAVAQNLTFAKMRLPLLGDAIDACDRERALHFLEDIRETLGDAHGSLREVITHFRTGVDARGLPSALVGLVARFTLRTGIPLDLDNRLPALSLPQPAESELFHIVQEALANVERHARARHGWVTLQPGLGRIELRVEDDGVGTEAAEGDKPADPAHYGIQIMRERAQRMGGELAVGPRPGGGTLVRCSLPLPQGGAA